MSGVDLVEVLGRTLPVIAFLLTITVVAEVADLAGVFDVAGHAAARVAGHRVVLLWLLLAGLAVLVTALLSLDTTAVLLTPVALTVARQLRLPAAPFALTTLFLANTASLFLPVANLTNLLAMSRFERLGTGHADYVAMAFLPGVAAVAGTLLVMWVVHRRELRGSFVREAPAGGHDPVLLRVAAATCVVIGPLFVLGVTPWVVSTAAATVLVLALRLRAPFLLRHVSVPWVMALVVTVVFLGVQVALDLGGSTVLASLVGDGQGAGDLARVAAVGAVAANAVNNLPAFIALESVAGDSPRRLMALLVGTNVAPIVTPWGSLATILWWHRVRAAGVVVRWRALVTQGAGVALVAGGAAVLALAVGA